MVLVVSAADGVVGVPSESAVAAGVSSVVDVVWAVRGGPPVLAAAGGDRVRALAQLRRDLELGHNRSRDSENHKEKDSAVVSLTIFFTFS